MASNQQKPSAHPPPAQPAQLTPVYVWSEYDASNFSYNAQGKLVFSGKMSREAHQKIANDQPRKGPGAIGSFSPKAPAADDGRCSIKKSFAGYLLESAHIGDETAAGAIPSSSPRPELPQPWSRTARQLQAEMKREQLRESGDLDLSNAFFEEVPPIWRWTQPATLPSGSGLVLPAPASSGSGLVLQAAPSALPVMDSGMAWPDMLTNRTYMDAALALVDSAFA
ncbi:hypothetical protein LTR08_005393 [Meristemomyces frigidus]|nr:hypothetical protein LTR08_005393 [Meristemomyces frigidus]